MCVKIDYSSIEKGENIIRFEESDEYNYLVYRVNSKIKNYIFQTKVCSKTLVDKSFCSFIRLALIQFVESENEIEEVLETCCKKWNKAYVQSDVKLEYLSHSEWLVFDRCKDRSTMRSEYLGILGSVEMAVSGEYLILNSQDKAIKIKLSSDELCLLTLAGLQNSTEILKEEIVYMLALEYIYKLYLDVKHSEEDECRVK